MKSRTEKSFIALPEYQKRKFSKSPYVRFTEAIFTHPVLTGKEKQVFQRMLYKASLFAGLNCHKKDGAPMDFEYFVDHCLYNETQSALATLIAEMREGTRLSAAFKEELQIESFDASTPIPILNIDMGGGTTDFTSTTLKRENSIWTLQRVYSQGVSFGGDHLDKSLLQGILSIFARDNCEGDSYVAKQVKELNKMLEFSSFESFCIQNLDKDFKQDDAKRLYYGLEMMLSDIEKIKVKNTETFRRSKNQRLKPIQVTIKTGIAIGSLFPHIEQVPKSFTVSLDERGQKQVTQKALKTLLEKMDELMSRGGTLYSELLVVLFSGQGYQYPSLACSWTPLPSPTPWCPASPY